MATPYENAAFAGSAAFPLTAHGAGRNVGDPDLAKAADYLYYVEFAPAYAGGTTYTWPGDGEEGDILPVYLSDEPDARALANLMKTGSGSGGTYVNPANTSSPDAVFALNLLKDLGA